MQPIAEDARVGVFGGSFNPPHVAHVLAVTYALLVAPLDHVLVVPVFQHPFSKELASFEHRFAMCERAFEGMRTVSVSAVERDLGGESKTLRTLEHLRLLHPGWRMRLILGSDVVPDLPKWHRFDRVASLAEPFIIGRRGANDPHERSLLPELSSTEVRALFARSDWEELASLLPANVLAYTKEHRLYSPSAPPP